MADIFTQAGEEGATDLIDGVSSIVLSAANAKVGWGTGAGTAVKGDTVLFTEASEARVAAAISQPLADQNQWVATITADGTKTITNSGLFDAAAAGILYVHAYFAGIALVSGDKIEFTITLQWA